MQGKLYLIPTDLGGSDIDAFIPTKVKNTTCNLKHFIVEDIRTARRYLSRIKTVHPIDEISFSILNEHTKPIELEGLLRPIEMGFDMGLLSEAGMPCIADPGADVVKIAHNNNIKVIPLVGPSSIIMALIASGMNGQNFAFVGYLPVKSDEREKRVRVLENRSLQEQQSQLFIEAPYRNNQLLQSLLSICKGSTRICVACNITNDDEFISTKTVSEWKKQLPDLHKKPCIFILQA